MNTLTKEALKVEVIDNFGFDDYEPNEADIKMVSHIMVTENKSLEETVDEYIRLDSKTNRLMHKGWLVFDTYYFANDEDALAFLKDNGINSFDEISCDDEYTYYTDWWEGEIPA